MAREAEAVGEGREKALNVGVPSRLHERVSGVGLSIEGSRDNTACMDDGESDFRIRGGKGMVCVTGGTGYIGSSLIQRLLQLGYSVRATVRNTEDKKIAFLRKLEGAGSQLTVVAADLLEEGSFDAATEGVEGVFHTAGPVFPPHPDSDPHVAMIDPTVRGTLNVLESCAKSSTVKKVVFTSSCAAIRYDYNRTADGPALDELCWSNMDYCRQHQMWYALAKTQAEREAWRFAQEHNVNLVVVNPSYIVGPFLGEFVTSTMAYMLSLFRGEIHEYPNQIIGFVHIDDVVEGHILVYEKSEAHGRYICSSFVTHWREFLSMFRRKYPALKFPAKCKEDDVEAICHAMNADKIRQLGIKSFKGADTIVEDCVQGLACKGLLPTLH